jgi:pyruvate/2-oxoglutarate/acetoin dehydrogenase E1 component/TPP-dependent pyruvate/acetoin dehydrogenase alpha subunit
LATKAKSVEKKFKRDEVLNDFRLLSRSREASLIGRREVLSGKAKFGIFGDGKELAQIAMAKVFKKGDFRSGYYRDQTFMMAIGEHTAPEFFAQLYAHPDLKAEPATGGRAMNAHFATRSINPDGTWKDLTKIGNSASDISPTASQMPRLVGLTYASRLYRDLVELKELSQFSNNGNEIAFGTIGNASCAEGMFWESINAIGVLQGPLVLSIWDDEYGISVPNELQLTKDLSSMLSGFQRDSGKNNGFDIYTVKGWDYPALIKTYAEAAKNARKDHVPAIIHVIEMTQPQGHSTSGSQERYKSKTRLAWEEKYDCLDQFRTWIISENIATEKELSIIEKEEHSEIEQIRKSAWEDFKSPIREEVKTFSEMLDEVATTSAQKEELEKLKNSLSGTPNLLRQDIMQAYRKAMILLRQENNPSKQILIDWKSAQSEINHDRFSSELYEGSALKIKQVLPKYSENSPTLNGYEILNQGFDAIMARESRVIAFGEDLGYLGDVNQGFAGMQKKYGDLRVSDTGIRETTIIGQAIGLALRGLRPIAEIQYLDYLLYTIQILSDDLATLSWRTKGGQKAPVIVRTRGHRLEGIWHSGSPMAAVIHLLRGMLVLVPRNMVQAIGFYNTLLAADEPGLIVEVLSGYRLKEKLPSNLSDIRVPVGVPEVIREGSDITIVTYGALVQIAENAAKILADLGVDVELIDVQSLLPFDINGMIGRSLQKTNRVIFLDEDVPGGTSAYMMQEVIEGQGAYSWLDSEPRTLSAKAHRPAYGSDGNYWSKPNLEDIIYSVYDLMHEANPTTYPKFY